MNFYFEASEVLNRLDAKEGSIKGILATLPENNRARTAALVIETLKYKSVLSDIIQASKLLTEEKKKITSLNLALVLVHDILLANGIQAGDGPIKQAILRHKTRLKSELQRIKIKRGVKSDLELAQSSDDRAAKIPRYVRVNTSMWSTEDAILFYTKRGFQLQDPFASSKGFQIDEHIPDLLAFNPAVQFRDDPSYKTGKIILQDKASCFSAFVLSPPCNDPNAVVIDATAAPGNKTSHLSALMGNMGKLYAFEKDKRRFSTLKMMLAKAACRNVEAINADFLTVDPSHPKYSLATHILLDPSCSGSGIVNRLDYLLEDEVEVVEEDRLNKLAAFQLMMIKHAMKFPHVQKIVYSTCSIHATENEHVVGRALQSDEAKSSRFKLAPRNDVLPKWNRRGQVEEMTGTGDADSLVRCSPGEDGTNGFFVSCFIREHNCVLPQAEPLKKKRKPETEEVAPEKRKKKRKKKVKIE
ncbi:S-adenosyl-L-methionine-dependent methyltransferase [Suillus clintonianus]|uniref:S-adenosyl-L-methionine-dependent methyltransferase n=1 Tax=Suillus clintonianus TaxID=1904413 RepID=UPI001B8709F8|nr:S-adenosyl-L-methionine-dependent methyltransferase [Suillus clintonianus]KAG2147675.1 S-adenosyl-L-methionine-dependent methyltransferase [Suillus clintonianus]